MKDVDKKKDDVIAFAKKVQHLGCIDVILKSTKKKQGIATSRMLTVLLSTLRPRHSCGEMNNDLNLVVLSGYFLSIRQTYL